MLNPGGKHGKEVVRNSLDFILNILLKIQLSNWMCERRVKDDRKILGLRIGKIGLLFI